MRLRHRLSSPLPLVTLLLVGACGESRERAASPSSSSDAAAAAPARRVVPPPQSPTPRGPDRYQVAFTTSKGTFVVDVTRALAPRGSDRFFELVQNGYYDGTKFYRVVPGFITQWGLHGDTTVSAQWHEATIPDDEPRVPNARGRLAFAANGPDSRATEVFIATGEHRRTLDRQRFAPFGTVVSGMDVVERITAEYGEEPNYSKIVHQGNRYLTRWFPALDSVVTVRIVKADSVAR